MLGQFELAGGSVAGRCHRVAGKNNQDALSWATRANCTVAVVCDGCGSALHSEVGAQLGARLISETVLRLAITAEATRRGQEGDDVKKVVWCPEGTALCSPLFWERARQGILAQLLITAAAMGGPLSQLVCEYFLFTVVGVLITPEYSVFFSIGDGVFLINGEELRLGPFPGNAPPYIAYGLIDAGGLRAAEAEGVGAGRVDAEGLEASQGWNGPRFQINRRLPTRELQSFVLGSDGVGDFIAAAERFLTVPSEASGSISQFWTEDGYFRNPDKVRRRLASAARDTPNQGRGGLLPDDTTLIVGRPAAEGGALHDSER